MFVIKRLTLCWHGSINQENMLFDVGVPGCPWKTDGSGR